MAQELIGNSGVYTILQEIGSGSYGSVHLLQERKTQKYFACKMISKSKMRQYQTEDMIRSEIQIQSSLQHKNILKLIEWFEDNSYIFIVLEYCSKGHLKVSTIDESTIFNVLHQLMCGIDYLHTNKIVHRDLKPENILITEDGTLKICDFGWACQIGEYLRTTVSICGTTQYMPPEVVQQQCHDYRLDIWSLGVLIYYILHKVEPFGGKTQEEIINKILNTQIRVNKSIDEDLQIMIQAMLTKQLDFRPTIQQLFISKWMKRQMRARNIYNKYENEELKKKLRSKQTQIKSIGEFSQPQNRVLAYQTNSLQLSANSSQKTNSTNPCSPMYQSRMEMFTFRDQEIQNHSGIQTNYVQQY